MAESIDIRELNERIERQSAFVTNLTTGMDQIIVGQKHLVESLLIGLLSDGHVLLEGVPGLAKTLAIKTLASLIDAKYSRIQFTPDLLPADVIGTMVYSQKDESFKVQRGPIFANFVLADEINRTSPKTQAALLEAMEEHNVTVDGVTYDLPHPFITMATQNPMGSAGTQPLPESQLDRFMICLSIGYPNLEKQIEIIKSRRYDNPIERIKEVASKENVIEVQNYLSSVRISDDVLKYIVLLCEKTREMPLVELGVSPRGVLALVQMAKAHAVLEDRIYVILEDVQCVFLDVCAHRMILRPQARVEGLDARDILNEILKEVKPPLAD